ncbi:hypothetical protein DFJ74DRAFT_337007 [Hyaloraphidium curvatum]|nr:hypothetical protein DFJ74DRAFT_337007 [Hyaloraphidium curvatum]
MAANGSPRAIPVVNTKPEVQRPTAVPLATQNPQPVKRTFSFRKDRSIKTIDAAQVAASAERFAFPRPDPPEPLQWVTATVSTIPPNAVKGGFEAGRFRDRPLQIARVMTQYGLLPGKVANFVHGALVGLDGVELASPEFEVLTVPGASASLLVWRQQSGPLKEPPPGAVQGGTILVEDQNVPIYLARVKHQGGLHSGYVRVGDELGMSCGWGGVQLRSLEYEVLVLLSEQERTREALNLALEGTQSAVDLNTDHPDAVSQALCLGMKLVKVKSDGTEQERLVQLDADTSKLLVETGASYLARLTSAKPTFSEIGLSSIREIREGITGRAELQGRSFTVLYELGTPQALRLVCPTPALATAWVTTLRALVQAFATTSMQLFAEGHEASMAAAWKMALTDIPKKGQAGINVNMDRLSKLFFMLNFNLSKDALGALFKTADLDQSGELSYDEFSKMWRLVRVRKDVQALFDTMAEKSGSDGLMVIPPERLRVFLTQVQKMPLDDDQFNSFVTAYAKDAKFITAEDFAAIMTSRSMMIFDPMDFGTCQDMTRPMTEYYINSSHNTYLLGDQLKSESSVEGYIRAFQLGVKCVELDTWDGADGQPVIYHGFTLTSAVKFRDVIETIKKYAFCVTDYPAILSLENHCSIPQQEEMAKILREVLGDALITEPVPSADPDTLPSPESLRGRFLLKDRAYVPKKLEPAAASVQPAAVPEVAAPQVAQAPETVSIPATIVSESIVVPPVESSTGPTALRTGSMNTGFGTEGDQALVADSNAELTPTATVSGLIVATAASTNVSGALLVEQPLEPPTLQEGAASSESGEKEVKRISTNEVNQIEALEGDIDETAVGKDGKPLVSQVSKVLGSMVVYFQNHKFAGLDVALREAKACFVSSFSEVAALKLIATNWAGAVEFNKRQTSRIYPWGGRVDSSNYNPQPFWDAGAQMVALNMQTVDKFRALNRAMFWSNGDSGYVLKPDYLRGIGEPPAPHFITIEIISAQQLPKPADQGYESEIIDPFVEVEVFGRNARLVPPGMIEQLDKVRAANVFRTVYQTKVIEDNGFAPIWNEKATWVVDNVDTAFIRFEVWDSDYGANDHVCHANIRAIRARQGYRHIPLRNVYGNIVPWATLFVKIELTPVSGPKPSAEVPAPSSPVVPAGTFTGQTAPAAEGQSVPPTEDVQSAPPTADGQPAQLTADGQSAQPTAVAASDPPSGVTTDGAIAAVPPAAS